MTTYTELGAKEELHQEACHVPWNECPCPAAEEIRRLIPKAEANFARIHWEHRRRRAG